MQPTLREFVAALEKAGELHRVKARVSPLLEVTEIADRVSKSPAASVSEHAKIFDPNHAHLGGKAILFENVEGSSMPLLINAFGSYRRMEIALGVTDIGYEGLADRVAKLVKPEPPTGLIEKLKKLPELAKIASFPPKVVRSGVCQEIVKSGEQVNLFELPIIKCWPDDGDPSKFGFPIGQQKPGEGRYITFGGVHTIHPDDAGVDGPRQSRNIGMYRAQLLDKNKLAMHWHMHHDGARHWRAWKKLGKPMPVAIALGGESVLPFAATAPLPPGISEFIFAGFLNDGGIEVVPCKTVDLHVPANSEIVIEGFVSTESGAIGFDPRLHAGEKDHGVGDGAVFEGPFGDHTGFYSLPDRYPIFTVTAVTHRRDPIYPTTIVGLPPMEDYYMGKATERIFLPLLKTLVHDIIDYHLPMFGVFHSCAFIKIKKEYPLQARRVMHAIWGAGQMAWTKMIVVVDEHVNVHDQEDVLFHLCANCDPGRDIEIVNGPLDILDHAAPRLGAGHKIGFDATAKIPGEEVNGHPVRDWPTLLSMAPEIKGLVDRRWREYGF
ncbi:MAG: UbiD family decarboxylase [Planctomycetes bacterium]|nr:UbiD family decarboxylase [Planctomycetota bacterium]